MIFILNPQNAVNESYTDLKIIKYNYFPFNLASYKCPIAVRL